MTDGFPADGTVDQTFSTFTAELSMVIKNVIEDVMF
jgi:hypothetical protein